MSTNDVLVAANELQRGRNNPSTVILDCRFDLMDAAAGEKQYLHGHIPGALFAHLDDELAAPVSAHTGRHPLPSADRWSERLAAWGIQPDTQVVVYDGGPGALAARAWWLLRYFGHAHVRLLDGGWAAWQAAGLAVESGRQTGRQADRQVLKGNRGMVISTAELLSTDVGSADFTLVDARDVARFRGDAEPIDARAGHIPGALNLPFSSNLTSEGRWMPAETIAGNWERLSGLRGRSADAVMCGSGVTACHLVAACLIADLPEPRVYVGSWSEWITDPDRPVATGP